MPAFFADKDKIGETGIEIVGDDAFHIARSLRMAVGDALTINDGEGMSYYCKLTRIRDDACECEILSSAPSKAEPPVKITLYMAYPKGDKLETVIQKAVELGASKIVPFESERCVKRPKAEKIDKQTARLRRIAVEAAKQCGRGILPEVSAPVSFSEMLSEAKAHDLSLFCYEGEGAQSLKAILDEQNGIKTACAIVGSEGGFSKAEAERAREDGLIMTNLGPRILRCETAPAYVLSALSYRFEL